MKSTDWLPFDTASGFSTAAETDFMPALFIGSSAVTSPESEAQDYRQLSDSRLNFNAAFNQFQSLQTSESSRSAFEKIQQSMLDAINSADSRTEETQKAFYAQVSVLYIKEGKPVPAVIERLQMLSAVLNQVLPGQRESIMAQLAGGDLSPLGHNADLLDAYEEVFNEFSASGKKAPLLKAWFDFHAALADSIGERQVFVGLNELHGNEAAARWHEEKVQELKQRVGGRYLWD